MRHYGMTRLEIAWDLPISAGLALCETIAVVNGGDRKTPRERDPATHYERLTEQWRQQQN